jgi:hypothetical protein
MVVVMGNGCGGSGRNRDLKIVPKATPRGFEPLRAEPNGFLVPLGHSVNISFGLPKTKHLRRQACWDRGDLESGGKQRSAGNLRGSGNHGSFPRLRSSGNLSQRRLQGFPAVAQGLLKSCCKVSRRCSQGSYKACTWLSRGVCEARSSELSSCSSRCLMMSRACLCHCRNISEAL